MDTYKFISALFLTFVQFGGSDTANILFYNAVSSYSHRVAVWPWVEALAASGHNVTFLQPYSPKNPNPNVTEFFPKAVSDVWTFEDENGQSVSDSGFLKTRIEKGSWGVFKDGFKFPKLGYQSCESILTHPEGIQFVQSNKFDLVVVDFLFNECAYGLAQKWGAKTILYFSSYPVGAFFVEALGFGGTDELELLPFYSPHQTVLQSVSLFLLRSFLLAYSTYCHLNKVWSYYPKLDDLLRTKLNFPEMPSMMEMVTETDLVLYNGHFSESEARIFPPMFVPVPAMHAWDIKSKPLPKEMAEFIAGSEDGFIYVSFGSLADINRAPRQFQQIFLGAFANSNTRFLWKIEGDITKETPSNVFTASWMPQADILASPKCKGFISHGGLLGTQEAVLHGVPMIVLPIFGEQDFNAMRIEAADRGIMLEVQTLKEQQLTNAIKEILTNKKYKESVDKISAQLKDQQNSPIDTAVYWTEYVLRHDREDLGRLKPPKWRIFYWFQVQNLDVIFFFLAIALISIHVNFKILKAILHLCISKQKAQNESHNSQKLKRN